MLVYVLSKHGRPLMPCTPRKARVLLKEGKAKVVQRTPFTIQLVYGSSGYTQPIALGVDSGYRHIGLSAVTERREIFSADVTLRTDLVKLNAERRQYRRLRRSRKTWYRKPRFLNRKKPEGWFAPSIQHKLDSHLTLIERVKAVLPVTSINVEVANFDIQKRKNPDIQGVEYQLGEQYSFWNVREYVLHRDEHTCQHCTGTSNDLILEVHHLVSRQTGGDSPENLIALCRTCHAKVTKGEVGVRVTPPGGFKAATFMTSVRWKLIERLRARYGDVDVNPTYGYITKARRKALTLGKSHANDAFVIAGGNGQRRAVVGYVIKQVRKCNRKLFKGDRSQIRNTAPRCIRGFQRFDKVRWRGIECFIFGRRSTGYFDLRRLDGTRIHASAKATDLALLERATTLLVERRTGCSSPGLKAGVSAAQDF